MKYILFSFLFLILCIPFVQENFHFISLKKLEGVEVRTEIDTLNAETWFEGRFQHNKERSVNENVGMREFLVRFYNQYNYSLFHVTESPGVVIGKNDYLYLTSYTNNFSGKNFIGWPAIESNARRLKMLQDALKKKNIDLVVVLAPGKASYYAEYLPDETSNYAKQNNYNAYRKWFLKEGLNFLDLHAWFDQLKGKTQYKLYPKYGVHWSYYGTYLAADTLTKYIETLHKCELPDIVVERVDVRDSLKQPDYDVGELLNIFSVKKDTMPYPVLSYHEKQNAVKTTGLVISDSYAWQWNDQQFLQNTFADWGFWFYNKTMYPESFEKTKSTSEINYCEEIQRKNIIVVMASEGTLDLFPYGILEKTESIYFPEEKEGMISFFKLKMMNDTAWFQSIVQKAKGKNISTEQVMQEDAEWMVNTELKKKTGH